MHSDNNVPVQSGLFKNQIGPGVLKSSVKNPYVLQERQTHKAEVTEYVSILSFFSMILTEKCLLNARLEHSRSNLVFDIRYNFIFEMLY